MQNINPWRKIYDHPQSADPFSNGIPKFALYIDVEPTNRCNMRCLFCFRKKMARPLGSMALHLFERICKMAKKYGCLGVRFSRWGEPLLNKNVFKMIEIARGYKLLTHLTTNGLLLDAKASINLIKSNIDSLNISMQGLNPKEYNFLRNTNKYSLLENNIKNFISLKKVFNSKYPHIHLSVTLTNEKQKEIAEFKKYWLNLVDSVGVGFTWLGPLKGMPGVQKLEKKAKKLPHKFRCIEVMCKLSIDWDGYVSPCCLDYNRKLSIGNAKSDDLMDLWESAKVKAIRNLLSKKRQDHFELCSSCELNYPFRGKAK